MPNLQPHVTSLELSIALKEAGWPQEGWCFAWFKWRKSGNTYIANCDSYGQSSIAWGKTDDADKVAAAPLASELMGRMDGTITLRWEEYKKRWKAHVLGTGPGPQLEEHLPDALAKLALRLMKEGIIRF